MPNQETLGGGDQADGDGCKAALDGESEDVAPLHFQEGLLHAAADCAAVGGYKPLKTHRKLEHAFLGQAMKNAWAGGGLCGGFTICRSGEGGKPVSEVKSAIQSQGMGREQLGVADELFGLSGKGGSTWARGWSGEQMESPREQDAGEQRALTQDHPLPAGSEVAAAGLQEAWEGCC